MLGIFIIPTGLGCAIGGHNGDATTCVNLIASVCDELIIHPNCVNASDINEMASNCLYVEGSMIDRFLLGEIGLKRRKDNKILVVINNPPPTEIINSIQATKYTLGTNIDYEVLDEELKLIANFNEDGTASGKIEGYDSFINQVKDIDCDVISVATPIHVPDEVALRYFKEGGVNPWGGIEAKFSKQASRELDKPVAHSPVENSDVIKNYNEIVEARMAPELVSCSYIHCVLKGLQKAPIIGGEIKYDTVDFMISPYNCFGAPHELCLSNNIPIIYVEENKTILNIHIPHPKTIVKNYLEAAGYIKCMFLGINPNSIYLTK